MHGCLIENISRKTNVYHKQHLSPLVQREVKIILGIVVVTCDILKICTRDLPHPAPTQIFVWKKQHLCLLRNIEVQRVIGWLLWISIYTQYESEWYPRPFSCAYFFLAQTTPLSVGKQRGAYFRGFLGWLLRLSILTESSCAIDLPYPGLAWIIVWNKPRFCPLGSREVQSTEVSRDVCWYLQYGPNPSNSCMAQNTLLSVGNREA